MSRWLTEEEHHNNEVTNVSNYSKWGNIVDYNEITYMTITCSLYPIGLQRKRITSNKWSKYSSLEIRNFGYIFYFSGSIISPLYILRHIHLGIITIRIPFGLTLEVIAYTPTMQKQQKSILQQIAKITRTLQKLQLQVEIDWNWIKTLV